MRATSVALATGGAVGAPATLCAMRGAASAASATSSSAVAGHGSASFRDGGCAGGTGGAAGAEVGAAGAVPVKMGDGPPDPRSDAISTGSGDHAPGRKSDMRLRSSDATLAADEVARAAAALALATVGVPNAAATGEAAATGKAPAGGGAAGEAAAAVTRASDSRLARSFLTPVVSRCRSSSAAFSAATVIPLTSAAVSGAILVPLGLTPNQLCVDALAWRPTGVANPSALSWGSSIFLIWLIASSALRC